MDFFRAFDPRRALLVVGTLLAAFFCGHLMQSGFMNDTAIRNDAVEAAPVLDRSSRTPALPVPPAATLTPLDLPPPPPKIGANEALIDSRFPADTEFSPFGLPCTVEISATAAPGAMIRLHLDAPCHANQPLSLQHDALAISEKTDAYGKLTLTLPAMTYRATVSAAFPDGPSAEVMTLVPDVADYRRVALLWSGPRGMRLRATEPGARVGAADVWEDAPGSLQRALRRQGGFLTRIGQDHAAEVYSFPSVPIRSGGVVRVSLEAEVTVDTCGKVITARTVQAGAVGGAMVRDVSTALPECDAIGQVVTIDGAFRDLRIARR